MRIGGEDGWTRRAEGHVSVGLWRNALHIFAKSGDNSFNIATAGQWWYAWYEKASQWRHLTPAGPSRRSVDLFHSLTLSFFSGAPAYISCPFSHMLSFVPSPLPSQVIHLPPFFTLRLTHQPLLENGVVCAISGSLPSRDENRQDATETHSPRTHSQESTLTRVIMWFTVIVFLVKPLFLA